MPFAVLQNTLVSAYKLDLFNRQAETNLASVLSPVWLWLHHSLVLAETLLLQHAHWQPMCTLGKIDVAPSIFLLCMTLVWVHACLIKPSLSRRRNCLSASLHFSCLCTNDGIALLHNVSNAVRFSMSTASTESRLNKTCSHWLQNSGLIRSLWRAGAVCCLGRPCLAAHIYWLQCSRATAWACVSDPGCSHAEP